MCTSTSVVSTTGNQCCNLAIAFQPPRFRVHEVDLKLPYMAAKGLTPSHALCIKGCTQFTTSGAHDVIAITSSQKNDLCTEELIDENLQTLDRVSLPHTKARFFQVEKGESGVDSLA